MEPLLMARGSIYAYVVAALFSLPPSLIMCLAHEEPEQAPTFTRVCSKPCIFRVLCTRGMRYFFHWEQALPAVVEVKEEEEEAPPPTDSVPTTIHRVTARIEQMRYIKMDDAQDDRSLMSGWLNMLFRDRRAHARTALLMEREARLSCEAWGRSMDASDTARSEVIALLGTRTVRDSASVLPQPEISWRRPKMAPKRATRSTPAATTTTTSVTNAQLKALINQGVADALAARDPDRNTNGNDSLNSGTDQKKKMTDKYCPRGEIKKLEAKLWNLKIKRYVGGLPDMIHGSVVASKPKTMQEAIEIATELMDKKIRTFAERQTENKRKQDDNQQQQQQNKRQNTGRAYTAGSGEKKPYGGSKPLCPKCNYHHDGPCAPKCHKCNRVGHLARDCRSPANTNASNNQRGTGAGQKPTCYECGAQGHFKRDCPKLKNNNRGNQGRNGNAPAKVYAVGRAGTNPDSNVVTGTFLLNNRYASVLFDTGADRSFVSTAFSSQIDITPSTLDHYYDVELADGRIIGLNAIIRGCTLNFLNHPFNIDLMPIELGSLDVIIGMDWLAKYQAVIICAEKIVRIP
ncbi:putative reverse transcriptase domain-containing protein [Tanacetum coccineum]